MNSETQQPEQLELKPTLTESAALETQATPEVPAEIQIEAQAPITVEAPVIAAAAEAHSAPPPSDWVTFVPDPFGLPSLEGDPASSADDSDLSDEQGSEADLDLAQAAADFLPDSAELSADDLITLQNLAVAMSTQARKAEGEYVDAIAAPAGSDSHPESTSEAEEETLTLAADDPAESPKESAAAADAEPTLTDAQEPAFSDELPLAAEETTAESPAPDSAPEIPLSLDLVEAQSCIEALLFMSDKPLSAEKLHAALGEHIEFTLVQEALTQIMDRMQRPEHGYELTLIAGGYQFRTKPGRAALAQKLAKIQTQKLSGGAMETLAVIAYKQPVMKEDIDQVRGVDSSYFIRALLDRKLIRISGRSELPGRPMLYSTTSEFLELFGLKDLNALPSLREIEQMVPASQVGSAEGTTPRHEELDPRVRQMRALVGEMNRDGSDALGYNPKDDDQFLNEIREKVKAVPTSTPYLLAQDQASKEAAALAAAGLTPSSTDAGPAQAELALQSDAASETGAALIEESEPLNEAETR